MINDDSRRRNAAASDSERERERKAFFHRNFPDFKIENFDNSKNKDLIPYFKSKISNVDDINNFFVPILKNVYKLPAKPSE